MGIKRLFKRVAIIAGAVIGVAVLTSVTWSIVDPEGFAAFRKEQEAKREALRAERAKSEAEQEASSARAEAEEKASGTHCLSSWDGSLRGLKNAVKDALREPSSFEHIETRVTRADSSGSHGVVMEYRARNGFGGMNVERAVGKFSSETCELTETLGLSDD